MSFKYAPYILSGFISACGLVFFIHTATAEAEMDKSAAPAPAHEMHAMQGMPHDAKHADIPADIYAPAMNKMMATMHAGQNTGDADIDFARQMIPHHQAAIDMAEVLLAKGKDPELQKLGQDIIEAQKKEIAFMQDWLSRHAEKK